MYSAFNDEDESRPSIEQPMTDSADVHVAHAEINTDHYVPQHTEDNEFTIVDVRMAKDVIRTDGLVRGIIEVLQLLKF